MTSLHKFDPYGVPEEALAACQSLIFVIGLNPSSVPSHGPVWDALLQQPKPSELPSVAYRRIALDQLQLPLMKQKRQSYEWYTPKGVIKSNWLGKYLQQVPALITVFHTLDWTDPDWQQKKDDLVNTISVIKERVGGRGSRLSVVLLQSNSPAADPASPPGPTAEEATSSERAAGLCSACDLHAKHLFVLPLADPAMLPGYTARLEAALSEIASGFYLAEGKVVRGHRDFLNKTNHQLLFVRHNFKIAFFSEMRNDLPGALKAYMQSYQHLSELRHTDTNLQELRIAAALINYKVCRVNFLLNLPRDAIAQFRRHIDLFRSRMGPKPLLFEHYAWLSAQYEMFGRLFESAVLQGLPAVQTQHPGFYYQQAAQFAALRRTTALHLCAEATAAHSDLLEGWELLEIYGQRPWRPGKHCLEPPEAEREANGVEAVQFHELTNVRHCDLIIPLYSRAVAQFQRYKCPRIKQQLMVHMSTEYHKSGDHKKALAVLQHVLWQYRRERWWRLVSGCSGLVLQCACLDADLPAYLAAALEMAGPRLMLPADEKTKLYREGVLNILRGQAPVPQLAVTEAQAATITQAWQTALEGARVSFVTVEMSVIAPCLEVRATFPHQSAPAYTGTPVTVHLRNNFTEAITVSKLRVSIGQSLAPQKSPSLQLRSQQQSSADSTSEDAEKPHPVPVVLEAFTSQFLMLPPLSVQKVELPFVPECLAANVKCLKISGVSCHLEDSSATQAIEGDDARVTVRLEWTGAGNEGVTALTADTPQHPEFNLLCSDRFDTLPVISELKVHSREPNVDVEIEYDSQALVWEWLELKVSITSRETQAVDSIRLALALQQPSVPALEQTTQVSGSASGCSSVSSEVCSSAVRDIALSASLLPGGTQQHSLFVKSLTATTRLMTLTVTYTSTITLSTGKTVSCPYECTKPVSISAKIPFTVDVSCESCLTQENVSLVCSGQPFLVVPRIACSSHVPITLTQSKLLLSNSVEGACCGSGCVVGVEVQSGEAALDCFSVQVAANTPPAQQLPLGHYLLHWNRSCGNSPAVSMSVALPSVGVEVWGVSVEATLPPHTSLYTPTPVTYLLRNTTPHSVECVVTVEQSQYFVFTGNQQTRLRVLSSHCERLHFVLYPLVCGDVPLPRVSVVLDSSRPGGAALPDPVLARALPQHLHVKPQDKTLLDSNITAPVPGTSSVTAC